MADSPSPAESRRCNYFFLYDGSKVQEEGDPTRAGICFFYPEETPLDQQELLCGQLAGVCRCVSELSLSPVRLLRLRRSKFAVRMKEHFLWALSCSVDIPDVSMCALLDQLISLFCFYHGPVRQSYLRQSRAELARHWATYLMHLQGGSCELHHIFSCLRTIDSTNIDPLLLLKAALILQACQRCPLVLAGCILYRGRVVSTQMPPDLTVKVMVHETESFHQQDQGPVANGMNGGSGTPSSSSGTTPVFLTPAELQALRCNPVDKRCRSHYTPQPQPRSRKSRLLSRTLSDTPTDDSDIADPAPAPTPSSCRSSMSDESCLSAGLSSEANTPSHISPVHQSERYCPADAKSHDHGLSNGVAACKLKEDVVLSKTANGCNKKVDVSTGQGNTEANGALILPNGNGHDNGHEHGSHDNGCHPETVPDSPSDHSSYDELSDSSCHKPPSNVSGKAVVPENGEKTRTKKASLSADPVRDNEMQSSTCTKNGVINDTESLKEGESKENGTEDRRRDKGEDFSAPSSLPLSSSPPPPPPPPSSSSDEETLLPMALYQHRVRALVLSLLVEPHFHTDQAAVEEVYHSSMASLNGLEAHLRSSTPGGAGPYGPYTFAHYDCIQNTLTTNLSGTPQDRPFVRATALLHSNFSQTQTLQEAIVRNAGSAVYGTRSSAQETYFLQHATAIRNSGIPNHQDSAFSLPSKARHRLLKHGVNLL
ncbi:Hermansky-Pudlak syndrome 4 protein [Engraulis encrasicolus]|uniref:Hermansky-Pudlak syndrome 4 protein n=1 Tax=Engraulis encrasicolus TaxID=184585 RepID=UPI002FD422B0